MSELKACPFCGFDKPIVWYSNNSYVYCPQCGAKGKKMPEDDGIAESIDRDISIKLWNKRPIEDKYRKALEDILKIDSNGSVNGKPVALDKYQQNDIMKSIASEALK